MCTSSCLTFNQRHLTPTASVRPPMPLPLAHLARCPAHTMTAALIGFSLLRPQQKYKKRRRSVRKKNKKMRIAIFDRRLSLGFILRYFTRLWPSFSCFFFLQFSFFFWVFFAIGAQLLALLFLRNKVYISHIHHFWQLQLIVCNVGQMVGPV